MKPNEAPSFYTDLATRPAARENRPMTTIQTIWGPVDCLPEIEVMRYRIEYWTIATPEQPDRLFDVQYYNCTETSRELAKSEIWNHLCDGLQVRMFIEID
jgi:hypothetical protein